MWCIAVGYSIVLEAIWKTSAYLINQLFNSVLLEALEILFFFIIIFNTIEAS